MQSGDKKHMVEIDLDGDTIMNEWTECAYCIAELC